MNRKGLSRRTMLAGTVAASSGALSAGWSGSARAQGATRLRTYWWGAKERADRTNKVSEMFMAANPSISIAGETLGWGDYWTRMATQAAGRNLADLIQMDYGYIFDYARRKALLPLDGFLGKELDLSGFSQQSIDGGKVDGKIYGVSLGLNSTSLVFDRETLAQFGIAAPQWPMTWDELGASMAALTKAVNRPGYWGMTNSGGSGPAFEVWLAERGKDMYTAEGKFGADATDMADWFGYWERQRANGSCLPPEVQALDKLDIDTNGVSLGKCALTFSNSNQLVGFQALNKRKLDIAMYPAGASKTKSGQYLKPSQMWSIAATTKAPEAAARLLSYFVSDINAGKVLGVERGIPASKQVRDAIEPQLGELDSKGSAYIAFISDKVRALPPPPPRGAGEVLALMVRTNETIGFRKQSVADASKQFMRECESIVARG
jgi:multiple sugar transport system substrate-binding protein